MKINLPVSNREILLKEGQELISTTDLKGCITSYNNDFKEMSGFEDEELQGKNHNLIRHPDMPVEAFADLWDSMKANQHWMGIVKNRAKNGDHYWVDAYVTPVVENGETVGYESVRAKPTKEQVERADAIYTKLRDGKKPMIGNWLMRLSLQMRSVMLNIISLSVGVMGYWLTPSSDQIVSLFVMTLLTVATFISGSTWAFMPLKKALKQVHKEINNPLMALIYTGRDDEIGQLQLLSALEKAKLRTVLGRINEAADSIQVRAEDSARSLSEINQAVQMQASETEMVATAMTQMSSSVKNVANNAAFAAEKAEQADSYSKEGVSLAADAVDGIQGLHHAVDDIAGVVTRLDNDAKNIGRVSDVIKDIAEQTNLLALNAAIEAARAGQQGRGFAVVADEVRTLAGRTQDSTQEIQQMIENLNVAVAEAIKVVEQSQESAEVSEKKVSGAIKSLGSIAEQVSDMNDLNVQIAQAVDEQGTVSQDINRNVVQISDGADSVLSGARSVSDSARALSGQAKELLNMILRFKVV